MTRYHRLLAIRRALSALSAKGGIDLGPKFWRVDALIFRERQSHRYTGVRGFA